MNATQLGLLSGLALGLAAAFAGFGAFVVVLLLGAIGLLVGRHLDGKLDLGAIDLDALTGRGSDRAPR